MFATIRHEHRKFEHVVRFHDNVVVTLRSLERAVRNVVYARLGLERGVRNVEIEGSEMKHVTSLRLSYTIVLQSMLYNN